MGKECVKQTTCQPPMVPGPVAGQCICPPPTHLVGNKCEGPPPPPSCQPPMIPGPVAGQCKCPHRNRSKGQGMRAADRMPLAADPECVRYDLHMPGRIGAARTRMREASRVSIRRRNSIAAAPANARRIWWREETAASSASARDRRFLPATSSVRNDRTTRAAVVTRQSARRRSGSDGFSRKALALS